MGRASLSSRISRLIWRRLTKRCRQQPLYFSFRRLIRDTTLWLQARARRRRLCLSLVVSPSERVMKLITGLLVLFTSALLGFASDAARESQVDDVREAVFRYQFDHSD